MHEEKRLTWTSMILDEVISDEYLIGRNIFGTKLDEMI